MLQNMAIKSGHFRKQSGSQTIKNDQKNLDLHAEKNIVAEVSPSPNI